MGIKTEALGKRYRIRSAGDGRRRLPWQGFEMLWALHDVSLEVPRGSTLGVIGRNGAGKTTLLKILSRVTVPTAGRALISGRASSLLEVGTGFHPDLTGRENVYFNGTLLGMKRREIARKFDEIVEFSEIGAFIDTPVKRYSTGMSLRLAFAVAAHLDADVLLVDEVLAVGDAAFQAKCLGKMDEVTGEGRTVVLVSHSMPTILSLADRCVWLDGGEVRADGAPGDVVKSYLEITTGGAEGHVDLSTREREKQFEENVRFAAVRMLGPDGVARARFYEGEPVEIEVELDVSRAVGLLELRVYVKSAQGLRLFGVFSGKRAVDLSPGRYKARATVDPNHLRPGRYTLDVLALSGVPQDAVYDAAAFEVHHDLAGYEDPLLAGEAGALHFDYSWADPLATSAEEEPG